MGYAQSDIGNDHPSYLVMLFPQKIHKEGRQLYPSEGKALLNMMDDHSLNQIVHMPTRDTNTLDLIITSTPDEFYNVYSPYKFSDHSAIQCTMKAKVSQAKGSKINIKKYNQG